ncbi:hypothetical protein PLANPX_1990 [Lacipirellula parvula]|uniref:Uncharacterized protein n=1 Tax=Lacipirellula parvula TaxID=2650471 RepID=A0A5K7X750_9BACT|nr:recombinase family protein [Lacipirellula parvula]BBO32378.1 hypothetical protein PLANPX_1990 [Lacipirellula parvula]
MPAKAKAQALIPAVSYLRKSTKGLQTDSQGRKRERQEKSISQQRTEIEKLAKSNGYQIIREYADPGVSGWKREGARPDFARMLGDAASKGDFVAIICDDVDRFSRADWDDVEEDVKALKKSGIQFIVTVAQGVYDLRNRNDLGQSLKFIIDVWSSNQSSRKLSRRSTLKNLDRAGEGKRAAPIPYAMKNDGNGGLVHGDRKAVAVVKRIFQMFVTDLIPYNKIMAVLNSEEIPSPRGKSKWSAVTVRDILVNAVYAGDFTYGRRQQGKFTVVGADGELADAQDAQPKHIERAPVITRRNVYKPIVDRKTFDAAQRQAAKVRERFAIGKRDRHSRYVLSDILVCDHCGSKMAGATPPSSGKRRYYCGMTRRFGKGACSAGTPAINEEDILPQVMSLFFETRDDLTELLTSPPDDLVAPNLKRREQNLYDIELGEVTADLKRTREKLLAMDWDAETAMMIQAQLNKLVARQKELEGLVKTNGLTREQMLAAIDGDPSKIPADFYYTDADAKRLDDFWAEFDRTAISAAVPPAKINEFLASFQRDPFREDLHVLLNPIIVNEALRALGTEVRLHFKTTTVTTKSGTSNRYSLKGGRYRLGQFKGKIAGVSSSKAIKGSASEAVHVRLVSTRHRPRSALLQRRGKPLDQQSLPLGQPRNLDDHQQLLPRLANHQLQQRLAALRLPPRRHPRQLRRRARRVRP